MIVDAHLIKFDVRHRKVMILEKDNRVEVVVEYPNGKVIAWTLDGILNELEKVPE